MLVRSMVSNNTKYKAKRQFLQVAEVGYWKKESQMF